MADDLPLTARNLVIARNGRQLVDVEALTIAAGAPTVIIGPNGAGKSLLLRLLHGLIAPDSGTIHLAGRPLDGAARRAQAMVFQRPVILRRSVAGNIAFALRARGMPRDRRRAVAAHWLEAAGLADRAQQPARTLSGGEAQRLALVRALATEPRILFLDEPTASLDPGATQSIEALIVQASVAGTKIVLVTHDHGQARRLAGDVLVLHQGRVLEHAPAARFWAGPQDARARDFLAGKLLV